MNIFAKITIQTILEKFIQERPVNRLLSLGFEKGKPKTDAFVLINPDIHFQFLEAEHNFTGKNENDCHIRVHYNDLISNVQSKISEKDKYELHRFIFEYDQEAITVEVTYDISGWYTITSPHLNKIAQRAIDISQE